MVNTIHILLLLALLLQLSLVRCPKPGSSSSKRSSSNKKKSSHKSPMEEHVDRHDEQPSAPAFPSDEIKQDFHSFRTAAQAKLAMVRNSKMTFSKQETEAAASIPRGKILVGAVTPRIESEGTSWTPVTDKSIPGWKNLHYRTGPSHPDGFSMIIREKLPDRQL